MKTFSALDLQKKTGDIQFAAAVAPVVITKHGKPRSVMMSHDEFVRLKRAAGEPIPALQSPEKEFA